MGDQRQRRHFRRHRHERQRHCSGLQRALFRRCLEYREHLLRRHFRLQRRQAPGQRHRGSATCSGSVSVYDGTLGGTGLIAPAAGGNVSIGSGGNLQAGDPSVNNGVGTLTLGTSGHPHHARPEQRCGPDRAARLSSNQVDLNGDLYINGNVYVNIQDASGATPGDYQLLTYSGNMYGNFGNLNLASLPKAGGALVNDTADHSIVFDLNTLSYTAPPPLFPLPLQPPYRKVPAMRPLRPSRPPAA